VELAPGLKLSEAGPIPEDWEVVRLGDSHPFVTSGSRGWSRYYADTGDLFVRITNMFRNEVRLDLSDVRFVQPPPDDAEVERTALRLNDLLISITADIGIVSLVTENVPLPAFINQHIAAVRLASDVIDPHYAAYALKSDHSSAWFRAITDAGAKAGINLSTVRKTPLVAPPVPEQRAIAALLGDVDAWIAAAEAEAAKLASLKAATISALLTPAIRLPSFDGEWVKCRLGDRGSFKKGRGITRAQVRGSGLPAVRYGELYTRFNDHIRGFHSFIDKETASGALRLSFGDICFAASGETTEEIGKCAALLVGAEAYAGGDIIVFTTANDDPCFLGYYLNTVDVAQQKARLGQGDAVVHIHADKLADLEVAMPTVAEQCAIAAVLTDIDVALRATRAVVAKARGVKAAAMDALLSGRVRLPLA
jgi:type I restriction enzyme S subunit